MAGAGDGAASGDSTEADSAGGAAPRGASATWGPGGEAVPRRADGRRLVFFFRRYFYPFFWYLSKPTGFALTRGHG